jgi:hypothetical protein
MDLNLKEVVGILDVIKNLSWGSIPLWLALSIPVFYSFIKKIIPSSAAEELNETRLQKFIKLFKLPKFENWVIITCVLLFIIGTFTIVAEKNYTEKIRNKGLMIKNYMINGNSYSIRKTIATDLLNIKESEIEKLLKLYPNDFILTIEKYNNASDSTIVLTDSATLNQILTRSAKILDSYLSNPKIISDSCNKMNSLFNINNMFTYRVCFKLISDSNNKYYYCNCNGTDAIIKK